MSREFRFIPEEGSRQPEILSVEEAELKFKGRWILMQVAEENEEDRLITGEIIYTSRSRSAVSKALKKQTPRSEQPSEAGPYYIFRAPPHGANVLERQILSSLFGELAS